MEDRNQMLMNFVLNDARHLKRFIDNPTPFKPYKKQLKNNQAKLLHKGNFYCYSKVLKQFKQFYFELYPNLLFKYSDKTKSSPVEFVLLQYCIIYQESEVIGEQVAFGIVLETETEITKLVTDKYQIHKQWSKSLRKYCRIQGFLGRYKVDCRLYDHFYRCIDKKKRIYAAVKIVNKKGLKPEQKKFIESEIAILRRVNCSVFPQLKKVYEDENYIYLTFQYFHGEDLLRIVLHQNLEEMAIATITYHIIKGIKQLHSQNAFHGNIKLENIIFSSSKKENEIFLINLKNLPDITEQYRERLIRKGNNFYCAPEVLEGKNFGQEIDLFACGCCIFYMIFGRFPYRKIENQYEKWTYQLDLAILDEMKKEKKKDPSSNQALSVSGIDLLNNLLEVNPEKRVTAKQALTHHWFINFTSKSTDNKKLQKFRELNGMASLRTILESSEISEREFDLHSRNNTLYYKNQSKISKLPTIAQEKDFEDDDFAINCDEENINITEKLNIMHDFKNHKDIYNENKIQQKQRKQSFLAQIQNNQEIQKTEELQNLINEDSDDQASVDKKNNKEDEGSQRERVNTDYDMNMMKRTYHELITQSQKVLDEQKIPEQIQEDDYEDETIVIQNDLQQNSLNINSQNKSKEQIEFDNSFQQMNKMQELQQIQKSFEKDLKVNKQI